MWSNLNLLRLLRKTPETRQTTLLFQCPKAGIDETTQHGDVDSALKAAEGYLKKVDGRTTIIIEVK